MIILCVYLTADAGRVEYTNSYLWCVCEGENGLYQEGSFSWTITYSRKDINSLFNISGVDIDEYSLIDYPIHVSACDMDVRQ